MAVELQHVKFAMLDFSEEINPVFRMCMPIPVEVDFPADHLLLNQLSLKSVDKIMRWIPLDLSH